MAISVTERLCDLCKHRRRGTHPPTCDAYPDRIPLAIRLMRVDHRQPAEGDHGIRFEPVDDSAATRARVEKALRRGQFSVAPGELQRRVAAVLPFITFPGDRERQLFGMAVSKASTYEELSGEVQALIRAGEQAAETPTEGSRQSVAQPAPAPVSPKGRTRGGRKRPVSP